MLPRDVLSAAWVVQQKQGKPISVINCTGKKRNRRTQSSIQESPVLVCLVFALRFFSKVYLTQESDRGVADMPSAEWSSVGPVLNRASGKVHG